METLDAVFRRERTQCPDNCNILANERDPKVSNHLYICVFTVALSPGPNNIACVCCAGSCLCSVFGYFNLSEICEFKPQDTYYLLLNPLRAHWHIGQKQGSFTVFCLQLALQPDPNSNLIVPVLFRLSSTTFFWVVHVFFFQPVSILVMMGT